ncbi:ferredoxin [Rhodococcoides fascians]|uniref:ferredoxin n=1 Tax=Rhodococcoides fascians TaxID=1828 RepID=UPI00050C7032|nr:ferredoxin [Rhodococcus fascians]
MKIEVDRNKCEGHGLCEQVGPQVYQLDGEGELTILQHDSVDPDLQAQALSGARSCPVAALIVHS